MLFLQSGVFLRLSNIYVKQNILLSPSGFDSIFNLKTISASEGRPAYEIIVKAWRPAEDKYPGIHHQSLYNIHAKLNVAVPHTKRRPS